VFRGVLLPEDDGVWGVAIGWWVGLFLGQGVCHAARSNWWGNGFSWGGEEEERYWEEGLSLIRLQRRIQVYDAQGLSKYH